MLPEPRLPTQTWERTRSRILGFGHAAPTCPANLKGSNPCRRASTLSLRDYLRVLRKRWRLIVAVLLVCILAGSAYLLSSTKKYEATAQIFVSTAGAGDTTAADLAQGNTFTQARVQSYTSVANSPTVTDFVV